MQQNDVIFFPVTVGFACTVADKQCDQLANSECGASSKCSCKAGFYGADGSKTCAEGNIHCQVLCSSKSRWI